MIGLAYINLFFGMRIYKNNLFQEIGVSPISAKISSRRPLIAFLGGLGL